MPQGLVNPAEEQLQTLRLWKFLLFSTSSELCMSQNMEQDPQRLGFASGHWSRWLWESGQSKSSPSQPGQPGGSSNLFYCLKSAGSKGSTKDLKFLLKSVLNLQDNTSSLHLYYLKTIRNDNTIFQYPALVLFLLIPLEKEGIVLIWRSHLLLQSRCLQTCLVLSEKGRFKLCFSHTSSCLG